MPSNQKLSLGAVRRPLSLANAPVLQPWVAPTMCRCWQILQVDEV